MPIFSELGKTPEPDIVLSHMTSRKGFPSWVCSLKDFMGSKIAEQG